MRILYSLLFITFLSSCSLFEGKQDGGAYYGKKIDPKGSISISEMEKMMGNAGMMHGKVEAKIDAVCQAKGCWMDLLKTDSTTMRVTFKDYEFFVPKNIAGKTAVVEGIASYDTTSVEMLRHYAEDAGKSAAEVESITAAKLELVFEAEGVFIK